MPSKGSPTGLTQLHQSTEKQAASQGWSIKLALSSLVSPPTRDEGTEVQRPVKLFKIPAQMLGASGFSPGFLARWSPPGSQGGAALGWTHMEGPGDSREEGKMAATKGLSLYPWEASFSVPVIGRWVTMQHELCQGICKLPGLREGVSCTLWVALVSADRQEGEGRVRSGCG